MYEDIKKNKIKSGIIVFGFILFITLIVYYICIFFDLGTFSIIIALIVSILSAWSSYYYSDRIVLMLNQARPATEKENRKIIHILEALMISSGLSSKPSLYIIEDSQPNAFATGRDPEHAVICVTTALLEKLNYYETEGVIAHELAHIKNYDIRLSAIVSVMVGFVVMISDLFSRMLLWRRSDRDENRSGNIFFMLIGLICLILSPIFGKLMQLAISRKREFLADATAIEFTRNPNGLINALKKLDQDPNELKVANTATENMYIVNPFRSSAKEKKNSNLFSTHPSIEERIDALEHLK